MTSKFTYGEETYRPAFPPPPRGFDPVRVPSHRFGNFCHISYGLPFEVACARHVADTFHSSRVYVLASGSLARNTDALKRLEAALGEKVVGKTVGMKSHTLWSEVIKVVNECQQLQVDLIVTLGGGSLSDGAKLVAIALANDVAVAEDMRRLPTSMNPSVEGTKDPTIPLICIPTSLSGGEYSNPAGATEDSNLQKHQFLPPIKRGGPALVVLDPGLTMATPDSLWLSSGMRAVDHSVEVLCSLRSNLSSDADAERGLRQLVPGLLRCKRDKSDIEAHLTCQLGLIDAIGAVFRNYVPLGGSHAIGHMLGPLGVGHGKTSCILLPAVCKYNAAHGANVERQKAVLTLLWSVDVMRVVAQEAGLKEDEADLGDMIDAFVRSLGLPRSLKEVGVGRDKLDALAENSLQDIWSESNPVPLVRREQILEILEMVVD
ncbi:putative Fe-containing alcohol dehydrogenase [Sparassis latifolia]